MNFTTHLHNVHASFKCKYKSMWLIDQMARITHLYLIAHIYFVCSICIWFSPEKWKQHKTNSVFKFCFLTYAHSITLNTFSSLTSKKKKKKTKGERNWGLAPFLLLECHPLQH